MAVEFAFWWLLFLLLKYLILEANTALAESRMGAHCPTAASFANVIFSDRAPRSRRSMCRNSDYSSLVVSKEYVTLWD